ncbi:MAG TPA: hypothetical protein VK517_19970 [Cyclobacteriaceae bacterium]|nr:hypothetical protein [Cyclobacteriaceae bacterium]
MVVVDFNICSCSMRLSYLLILLKIRAMGAIEKVLGRRPKMLLVKKLYNGG